MIKTILYITLLILAIFVCLVVYILIDNTINSWFL